MAVDPILIGIPEIATIAGVSRAAVSNWRRRYPDFPEPQVQTDSGVLFDMSEVEAWMLDNGRLDAPVPPGALVWRYSETLGRTWPGDDRASSAGQQVFDFTSSWLCYLEACRLASEGPTPGDGRPLVVVADEHQWSSVSAADDADLADRLRAAASAISRANPQLDQVLADLAPEPFPDVALTRAFVAQLAAAADDQEPFAVFEEAQTRAVEFSRVTAERTTPDCLSHLLALLTDDAGATERRTILDPACGTGGTLLMAAVAGRTAPDSVECFGADVNQTSVRHSRARFFLYGIDADIRTLNSLREAQIKASFDVVVCDPPFSLSKWGDAALYSNDRWRFGAPSPSSADYAWLQLAQQALTPTGIAGVVLAAASGSASGAARAIRAHMVDMDVVEAFIQLPNRLRRDTSIPLGIWLLRAENAPTVNRGRVLILDASDLGTAGRSVRELSEEDQHAIVSIVQAWRRDGTTDPVGGLTPLAVTRDEIWERDVDLTPRRHAPAAPSRSLAEVQQARTASLDAARAAASELGTALRSLELQEMTLPEAAARRVLGEVADVHRTRPARDEFPPLDGVAGDIVLTIGPAGVSSRMLDGHESVSGFSSLLIHPTGVEPAWLFLWTRTTGFADLVQRNLRGNTIQSLAPRDVRGFDLLVPSPAFQASVAEAVANLQRTARATAAAADAVAELEQAVADGAFLGEGA